MTVLITGVFARRRPLGNKARACVIRVRRRAHVASYYRSANHVCRHHMTDGKLPRLVPWMDCRLLTIGPTLFSDQLDFSVLAVSHYLLDSIMPIITNRGLSFENIYKYCFESYPYTKTRESSQ